MHKQAPPLWAVAQDARVQLRRLYQLNTASLHRPLLLLDMPPTRCGKIFACPA